MPDTWTANREHLRDIMLGYGATCGVEPRVLKPRDPEWTCHIETPHWRGDIYIHPVTELFYAPIFLSLLLVVSGSSLLIGLVWGRWFWRRPH